MYGVGVDYFNIQTTTIDSNSSIDSKLIMDYPFMLWWSLGLSMTFWLNLPQHPVNDYKHVKVKKLQKLVSSKK